MALLASQHCMRSGLKTYKGLCWTHDDLNNSPEQYQNLQSGVQILYGIRLGLLTFFCLRSCYKIECTTVGKHCACFSSFCPDILYPKFHERSILIFFFFGGGGGVVGWGGLTWYCGGFCNSECWFFLYLTLFMLSHWSVCCRFPHLTQSLLTETIQWVTLTLKN